MIAQYQLHNMLKDRDIELMLQKLIFHLHFTKSLKSDNIFYVLFAGIRIF